MEKGGKGDDSIIQAQMSSKGEDFVLKAHWRIAPYWSLAWHCSTQSKK